MEAIWPLPSHEEILRSLRTSASVVIETSLSQRTGEKTGVREAHRKWQPIWPFG